MKSLHKTLDIIEVIAEKGSIGVRELSSVVGFPVGTTHRIVSTLAKRHFLVQNPVTRNYSLSLRFLELGTRVQQQFNLTSIVRPYLEKLMRETGESANLAVLDRDEAVYLDHVRSNHMLQLFTRLGARVPLYATGVGKMFLSRFSEPELKDYLARTVMVARTPHTIVNADKLIKELDQVSKAGFSVDNEEMEEGVRCVAALVLDHLKRPAAALSLSGAITRITPDRIEYFGEMVKRYAIKISESLGFNS
jgi:DNA-binding IclR family transcriptional regulator